MEAREDKKEMRAADGNEEEREVAVNEGQAARQSSRDHAREW